MKNRGFIRFVTILLAIVSIYQLSFTLVTRNAEKKARAHATETGRRYKDVIDSMRSETILNLGIAKFTYQECKQREINLGLDLQGGMNVTLEVSVPELVQALADNDQDPQFQQALKEAQADYLGQRNFIDIFAEKYEKLNPETGLARIFYRKERKEVLPNQYNSTNKEVYDWLKEESSASVSRTYKILKTRIDQFNVTQPNVQLLDNGRISVELPGVDNPERIRKVLQSSAKLEFWQVYRNYEAFDFLNEADKVIAARLDLEREESDSAGDAGSSLKPVEEQTTSLQPVALGDSTGAVTPAGDSNAVAGGDTAAADSAQQLTREEYLLKNPLVARLIPNADQTNNQWNPSAPIGYVARKDMDFFNKWLKDPEVRSAIPDDVHFRWSYKPTDDGTFYMLYALKASADNKPALEGDVVTNARPTLDQVGNYKVSMSMNKQGAKEWRIITANAKDNKDPVAIVLDSMVYSAPAVQDEIPNGQSEISGNFTVEDAEDLSNILKAGRLDAPTRIVEESVVGPSLGKEAIRAGQFSLVIGFVLVIVFMLLYYNRAGAYAVVALLANLFFILGVLSGYGAALTLPGMAGLVLTIGMAVDANVLIFERIKEELLSGKGFKAAVKNGYQAAYSSIIDANITTLIAAMILMSFGKGPVAGFAIILFIGILSSLFTAIFLTRLFVEWDISRGVDTPFTTSISKNLFGNVNWEFIGKRKIFYTISGIVIALGIVSMFTRGLSTGVDFKGGWSYVVQLDEKANTQDIRNSLNQVIPENVEVKTYGTNNQYKITTSYRIDDQSETAGDEVQAAIVKGLAKFNVTEDNLLSESKVGPTIAEDIKVDSSWAIILSLIGMFLYIVVRFRKWGYGLGATIALFHDVLIVFSIYSLLYGIVPFTLDIDQAFIAAILTVVGYSINDTVVVFDRVREFLGTHKYEKDSAGVINSAINQTLSRTLVTSLTTLLVVVILFLFGGEGLKGFTFALLVGIGVGTYSSICIATPVVVDMTTRVAARKAKKA
ncbi:MAG: protein translocase subunit SecDF [Flavobacteriales bacterium]|nr:protein translocase subunit SecDF [Flavobacteriales bacterium]